MFNTLFAYKNGTLERLVAELAADYLTRWPNWNETAAIAIAAAYYGRKGQLENEALTREARAASQEVDDLYYWLKEEAPGSVTGFLSNYNRALFIDMECFEKTMLELEARDWSQQASEQRVWDHQKEVMKDYFDNL